MPFNPRQRISSPQPPRRMTGHGLTGQRLTRNALLTACLVLVCLLGATPPLLANDSFYESLLDDGISAYAGSDLATAEKALRLANFGLMENPTTLAKGLTYLSLVYAAVDNRAGFERTFSRLLQVEEQFHGYSEAPLPAEIRTALLQQLGRWSNYNTLKRYPAFAQLARSIGKEELAALPVDSQRQTLRQRLADEPQTDSWPLLLALLELQEGDPDASLKAINPLLARRPNLAEALCIRGQAAALVGQCAAVSVDLNHCAALDNGRQIHQAILSCHLANGEYARGQDHLDGLSNKLRRTIPAHLIRGLRKGLKRQAESQQATTLVTATPQVGAQDLAGDASPDADNTADAAVSNRPESTAPPNTPPASSPPMAVATPLPSLSTSDAAQLDRIVNAVHNATLTADLAPSLEQARDIADANPNIQRPQHLVGELAYRSRNWPLVVRYIKRGGSDPARPDISFYLAVALEESGQSQEAAEVLRSCLPHLERTEFVNQYVRQILGQDP